MAEITMWDLFSQALYFFWAILDAMFNGIQLGFTLMFPFLPPSSIPFVIAIFCYSILAFLTFFINVCDAATKRIGLKIIYLIFSAFMILMFVWKLGLIALIPSEDVSRNVSEVLITIFYIAFAVILVISFLKEITWLKKGILIFTWAVFLLDVFIFAPVFGEMALNEHTLTSILIISVLFAVPNGLNQWKKTTKDSGDE